MTDPYNHSNILAAARGDVPLKMRSHLILRGQGKVRSPSMELARVCGFPEYFGNVYPSPCCGAMSIQPLLASCQLASTLLHHGQEPVSWRPSGISIHNTGKTPYYILYEPSGFLQQ
jgi:hypothetical protein